MTKIYLDRNVEDVNITTPADNNLLAWDEATQRWVNTALNATTSAKGVVELATSAETTAGLVVQASDTRLSDARTPTAHTHAGGDITSAVASATNADTVDGFHGNDFAPRAEGVTNGDSHDHSGGDGAQINHEGLSNIGTNTHAQIDTFISSKAAANGLASLSAGSLVVQNPANATATATASKIPIADGSGKLDTWVSDASTTVKGKVELATDGEATAGLAVQANDGRLNDGKWTYLAAPLTSTSFDGDAKSTTSKTKIDMSAAFSGYPASAKAALIRLAARDSGSAGSNAPLVNLATNNTAGSAALCVRPAGLPNDYVAEGTGIVPTDANGDIYYQVAATGTGTLDIWIEIWGYCV